MPSPYPYAKNKNEKKKKKERVIAGYRQDFKHNTANRSIGSF